MSDSHLQLERLVTLPTVQVALLARQLAIMLDAGVSLTVALEVLSKGHESEDLEMVVTSVLTQVEAGVSLSAAISRFPKVFPQVMRALIRVGEETGNLTGVLHSAASWMEADHHLHSRIRGALTYPAFVACTAFLLTVALFTTVVPDLLEVLVQTNSRIPALTRLVMAAAAIASNPLSYLLPLGCLGLLWAGYRQALLNRPLMAKLGMAILSIPVVGNFSRTAAMSRYTFACQTLLETGVRPIRVVDLAAEASGSVLLVLDRERVISSLQDGNQISEALEERPELYDPRIVQLLQAGEVSARIPDMLERGGQMLAMEVDMLVEKISSLLEPLLLFFIGLLVGTILIAIFMPLYASLQTI